MADKKSQAERVQQQTMTLGDQLAESIASLEFVQQAAIFDATGMLASAARPGHSPGKSAEELAPLCKTLMAFNAGSVRGRLRRAILDDERGTVLVSGIQKNRWVVIVSERGTPLGAVTVGMGRLVARLDALGSEAQKSSREVLAGAV